MRYRRKMAQGQMYGVVYFKRRDMNIMFDADNIVISAILCGVNANDDSASFDNGSYYDFIIAEDPYDGSWGWSLYHETGGYVASGSGNTSQGAFDDFKDYAHDAGVDFALADKL